jgi:hypothetical protein
MEDVPILKEDMPMPTEDVPVPVEHKKLKNQYTMCYSRFTT